MSVRRVHICRLEPRHYAEWLRMRVALWPECLAEQHHAEMAGIECESDTQPVFVAEAAEGRLVGFLEVSLRNYAEGCHTHPVAYLEGWYVQPEARRRGIGTALVRAAEEWALARGLQEMASDTQVWNTVSRVAHEHAGYEAVAEVVAFRKRLVR